MTIRKISATELDQKLKLEDIYLLDVRAKEKYDEFHIEGTIGNIPKNYILDLDEAKLADLPRDKAIVVTCTTGNSAAKCAAVLSEKYDSVLVLEGGITAWKEYINK